MQDKYGTEIRQGDVIAMTRSNVLTLGTVTKVNRAKLSVCDIRGRNSDVWLCRGVVEPMRTIVIAHAGEVLPPSIAKTIQQAQCANNMYGIEDKLAREKLTEAGIKLSEYL